MPVITLLGRKLATTQSPSYAALHPVVKSTNAAHTAGSLYVRANVNYQICGGGGPPFTIITAPPPVSFVAEQIIGVLIEMDIDGSGTLVTIPRGDLDPRIVLSGSLDHYGVRELQFGWYTAASPLMLGLLRSARAVRMTGYYGVPGSAIASRVMFNGYVRDASWSYQTGIAQITAQDGSLPFSQQPLLYNLAANSLQTRSQIVAAICAAAGITVGTLDLQGGGGTSGGGGTVVKAITEGGDRRVLDFLKDFLLPAGAIPYWRGGKVLNAKRFDTTANPIRTLSSGDFRSITITTPGTAAPNQVRVSGSIYAYIGPSGNRTVTTSTPVTGTYTPAAATTKQDHTTGATSSVSVPTSAQTGEVSRVDVTTVYNGGAIISQTIREFGWYARRAAPKYYPANGALSWNPTQDIYQFPDGSWRADSIETYQLIRQTDITHTFGSDGYLGVEDTKVTEFAPTLIPSNLLDNSLNEIAPNQNTWISDTGEGWSGGVETFYQTQWTSATYYQSTGQLVKVLTSGYQIQGIDLYAPTAKAAGASVFGPRTARWYSAGSLYTGGVWLFQDARVYAASSETQYKITHTRVANPNRYNNFTAVNTSEIITVAGSIPYDEQLGSMATAQAASITVTDGARSALGGATITEHLSNNYAETTGELRNIAIERLREHAIGVDIVLESDWSIQEGDVLAISHPSLSFQPVNLLVWSSRWETNGATGEATQTLHCRWYSPELAAA